MTRGDCLVMSSRTSELELHDRKNVSGMVLKVLSYPEGMDGFGSFGETKSENGQIR